MNLMNPMNRVHPVWQLLCFNFAVLAASVVHTLHSFAGASKQPDSNYVTAPM